MKAYKITKTIAIVSYLFIILMGDTIGLPFFMWLLFTLLAFGSADQLFAFFGVAGLILNFVILNSKKTLQIIMQDVLGFMLLASPLIRRLTEVPIDKFNYPAFIIPTAMFVLFYIGSLYFSLRLYLSNQKV